MDPGHYCREVETYLCRKNDGHLIRIVGPAFEQVCGWAAKDIPLSVVFRGIDRRFERYYAKGRQRHPLRIEFCEADVLQAFDEWLRAVGLQRSGGFDASAHEGALAPASTRHRESLASHVDRAIARLTGATAAMAGTPLAAALARVVVELDAMRADARRARGETRTRVIDRLGTLDDELTATLRAAADPGIVRKCRDESEQDLASFRDRMPVRAFQQAIDASTVRLLRERFQIPRLAFES